MPVYHHVDAAPQPVGPFCHATEAGGWVWLTGQMPTWPDAPDRPMPEGVTAQAERVLDNLRIVLAGLGLGFGDVVQCRCYLAAFDRDLVAFNAVYVRYFPEDAQPARTTVGVTRLALGALVEVDMVAKRP
jgi:reactive intermediate/imine deaminase